MNEINKKVNDYIENTMSIPRKSDRVKNRIKEENRKISKIKIDYKNMIHDVDCLASEKYEFRRMFLIPSVSIALILWITFLLFRILDFNTSLVKYGAIFTLVTTILSAISMFLVYNEKNKQIDELEDEMLMKIDEVVTHKKQLLYLYNQNHIEWINEEVEAFCKKHGLELNKKYNKTITYSENIPIFSGMALIKTETKVNIEFIPVVDKGMIKLTEIKINNETAIIENNEQLRQLTRQLGFYNEYFVTK